MFPIIPAGPSGARRPLLFPILLAAVLAGGRPASASKPDLDIPPDGDAMEGFRRTQTRFGRVLPSQGTPLKESALLASPAGRGWTAFDSALFAFELPSLRREALAWADSGRGHSIFFSPAARTGYLRHLGANSDSGRYALLTGAGLTVYGRAFSRLSFHSHALAYTEYTGRAQFTHQFDPRYGETYSVEKSDGSGLFRNRTFNRFENYVSLDLPYLTLKAGRDRVRMGPGMFSSLMAGSDTPPFYLLEARIDFAPWLSVDNYLLKMTDTDHDIRKFANLHRYEFQPRPWLEIAFQDIVIYQDRDPDWAYALPLVPFTFSEANNGGRDNAAMGFDFLCTRVKGFSFWGEVFIDDLVGPSTFFSGFWENRWAGLAGFQWVSPWKAADADLIVEYGHVEPWTYNGRKPQTSFRHFNTHTASKLGPDSRSLDVQASYRPARYLQLRSRAELNEKGTGRGATLGVIHDDAIDGTRKSHLAGDIESEIRLTQEAAFIWRQYLSGKVYWTALPESDGNELGMDWTFAW